jgi:hypothetical protein
MTKEQFRALAEEAIEEICSIPDELWNATTPIIRQTLDGEVVIVGIDIEEG